MNETTDSILVECPCEREAYRDKQNYPYRKDNIIKLTCYIYILPCFLSRFYENLRT